MPPAIGTTTESKGGGATANTGSLNASYRLAYRGGHWILVKKQLVALDRHVLRPQSRQFVGTETILHYLQNAEPHLKQRAAALMQARPESPDQTFGPRHGEWLETDDEDFGPGAAGSLSDEQAELLRDLRAELLLLRGSHQRLRARVAELERRIHLTSFESVPKMRQPRSLSEVEFARLAPRGAMEAPCEPSKPTEKIAATAVSPAAAEVAPVRVPEPFGKLTLPKIDELFPCLGDLLGSDVGPTASKDKLHTLESSAAILYVALLIDDENRQVGAFVLEASSVASMGGALLGIPARAIHEHIQQGEPSSDMIEAASEVCNNLSGVLNRNTENCHVRTGALVRYVASEVSWLAPNPPHSACFTVASGGKTWLVLR